MKKHAQAILLFTGYPLEPIVALQIQKSYQLLHVPNHTTVTSKPLYVDNASAIHSATKSLRHQ